MTTGSWIWIRFDFLFNFLSIFFFGLEFRIVRGIRLRYAMRTEFRTVGMQI